MRGVLLVKILRFFFALSSASPPCDMTTGVELDEGNMGQSSDFNWLGMLKVFLNDGDDVQVAVTGIMLVKANHALASADDIVRIPKRILQHDTRAIFISNGDVAVNYSLVSYVTHPEYQTKTFNSIAIILLNADDDNPLLPVCFPIVSFDTNYLYLTGFTDENDIIEKMFYRIQYMDRPDCEEFYEKEGLVVENRQPISYLCGKRQSPSKRCVWDNGLALVSNSSGWFTLIGFSIHGPGCAAPARFMNMLHYSAWISNVTRDKDDQADDFNYISPDFRRTDVLDKEYVPINRTFTALRKNNTNEPNETNTTGTDQKADTESSTDGKNSWPEGAIDKYDYLKWPFPAYTLEHFNIMPAGHDDGSIWIFPFNNTFEMRKNAGKNDRKQLLHTENFDLKASPGMLSTVTYKLSLYDLFLHRCCCVILEVPCTNHTEALLEFKEVFYYTSLSGPPSPKEVLETQIVVERDQKNNIKAYLKPVFIESGDPFTGNRSSYDLYIRYTFKSKAFLKFKMFSWAKPSERAHKPVFKKKNVVKMKFPRNKMLYWGSPRTADKSVKPAAIVVDREVVQDTVSVARRSDVTPGVVTIGCLLISVYSTRFFLV